MQAEPPSVGIFLQPQYGVRFWGTFRCESPFSNACRQILENVFCFKGVAWIDSTCILLTLQRTYTCMLLSY